MVAQYRKDATDPQWANSEDLKAWKVFMDKYQPGVDQKDSGTDAKDPDCQ